MFGIGAPELIVILVVALVVLGPKRLPELARGLGRTLGEFRRATSGVSEELDNARVLLEEEVRQAEHSARAGDRADDDDHQIEKRASSTLPAPPEAPSAAAAADTPSQPDAASPPDKQEKPAQ